MGDELKMSLKEKNVHFFELISQIYKYNKKNNRWVKKTIGKVEVVHENEEKATKMIADTKTKLIRPGEMLVIKGRQGFFMVWNDIKKYVNDINVLENIIY